MKIYKDEKYVKMIPARYEPIKDSILSLVEIQKKRLSLKERKLLELKLLMYDLKSNDKYVFELIDGHEFKNITKVLRRDYPAEYRAIFKDAPDVRVTSEIAFILNGGGMYKTANIL